MAICCRVFLSEYLSRDIRLNSIWPLSTWFRWYKEFKSLSTLQVLLLSTWYQWSYPNMANIENTASRSLALIVNKADGSAGLISLHIRNMWETICDEKASRKWHGKICAQIPQNTLLWNLVQNTPHLPSWNFEFWLLQTPLLPLENWNLGRSGHFEFWLPQNTPPPHKKLKFGQIWALWVLTTTEHTPQLKFGQTLAIWVLTTTEHPPTYGWSM